ncbi:MAG: alpha/beta hydrolase [Promethearchaeota archaeon]
MGFERKHRNLIISLLFLFMFIIGTILIFTIPSKVKITYGLNTKTEDGITVSFNVFEPIGGDKKKKAIIIAHGAMASKEFLKGYAIELAAAGFVAVPFDFRGHGQTTGQIEVNKLINEVKSIKEYLRERGDIDIHNLGIIGYSMGGYPSIKIVHDDKDFKCFIGIGTALPRKDYYPELVVKSNDKDHPLNVLIIQARYDEGVPLENVKEGLAYRLGTKKENIDCNKLYGNFQDGNASMIFLDDNSDHLTLCWDDTFIRQARFWIINTFPDVEPVDENFYVNIRTLILIIQTIGGIGFFFTILPTLSKRILGNKESLSYKFEYEEDSIKLISIKIAIYTFLLSIPGMIIMSPVLILLPLTLGGLMAVLLFGAAFGLMIFMKKARKEKASALKGILKEPFSIGKSNLLRHIFLGIILSVIYIMR